MTAIVFRAFFVFALSMFFPVATSACSVAPTHYPWIPKYEIYFHLDKENPLGKYDFIGLVTAELIPLDEERFEYYYGRNPKASLDQYATVKFNVSEVLKGPDEESFYFQKGHRSSDVDETGKRIKGLVYKDLIIKNSDKLTEPREIIAYEDAKRIAVLRSGAYPWGPKNFHERADFRDLFDLSEPRLKSPYRGGMCGNETIYTVFEGITYLAFKSGDGIVHLEPVNAEKDALVDWTRDEMAGKKNELLDMSFQDLFKSSSSNRYAVIEITDCPSQDRVLKNIEKKLPFISETPRFKSMSYKPRYTPKFKYAKFDMLVGNVKHRDISLKALEEYMKFIGAKNFQCRKGSQYFAFGRPKGYDARYAYSGFRTQSDFYNWRFMRIQNENIILEDFQTKLQLTNSKKLHLSEIIK